MISKEQKIKRMIEAAHLYYEEDKSQNEIAKTMGISRPLVSIILNEAKEQGIVTITINDGSNSAEQIAEKLRNIYKINSIIIVPDDKNESLTNMRVAAVAYGNYFGKSNDGKRGGIGWGYMIGRIADHAAMLDNFTNGGGALFPLAGGINSVTKDFHINELVRIFAMKTGREPIFLYAPALHDTPLEYELLKRTEVYEAVKEEWDFMEQALVSIANFPAYPDLGVRSLYGDALKEKKAVGRIMAHYFDAYGRIISPGAEATLQVSVKQLKSTNVTAACSNQVKPQCIIGALRTGIINTLILPLSLAEKVSVASF